MSSAACKATKPDIDAATMARFTQLATGMTGMEFPETRLPDLARAICETQLRLGLASTDALYRTLAATVSCHPARQFFISQLTIGETFFFRNQPQFEALEHTILPEIIERRRSTRQLRIWCAACSTGEEPYSVAILLDRLLPDYDRWNVLILGTDIDEQALARARQAHYGAWSFRQVRSDLCTRYFTQEGRHAALAPHIRHRVTFAGLNLVDSTYPSPHNDTEQMDLILCRNVLIYFSSATARTVAERMHMALCDEGWLLVGHAESSQEIFAHFRTINLPGTVAYRKQPPQELPVAPVTAISGHTAVPPRSPVLIWREPGSNLITGQAGAPNLESAPAGTGTARASTQEDGLAAYQLACRCADARQWQEAEQWVGCALERLPMFSPAHYLHALLLLEAGQLDVAITAARRCIYADASYVAGHLLLALLYRRSGDHRRAAGALRAACELLRQSPPDALVPDTDEAHAGQLLTWASAQLEQLGQ